MTPKEIEKLGGVCHYQNDYEYHWDSWEYLYNSKTQTFWSINDGFGEPELLVKKVKDLKHLEEILISLNLL